MAKVSVKVDGQGYSIQVEFPAVSGAGFEFGAAQAQAPVKLGKSADKAWIKERAKPLEALVAKAMKSDIDQIENYRKTLLKQDVMAKTVRDQVKKAKLEEKAAQALAEKLVAEDFAKRWEKFCKVTLPMGVESCFKLLIKDEAAQLRAQLAKEATVTWGDYSKRPALTILVSGLASVGAILAAASLPAVALAAVAGILGQAKAWVAHRKELSGKLAVTRDAEAAARSGVDAAVKGLEQATKALGTMTAQLKLALGAAALSEMEALAGQGTQLAALEAPQAAKARASLEAAAKARAELVQDLRAQAKRLSDLRAAVEASLASASKASDLLDEGKQAWDGTFKRSEAMLAYVDDALKAVSGLKSLLG